MLDTSRVEASLAKARAFAERVGLQESLEKNLRFLDGYGGPSKVTRATLYGDHAPYSFGFLIEIRGPDERYRPWIEGGLIFHGPHDGHGSGSGPAYAVTLEATTGWSIHT